MKSKDLQPRLLYPTKLSFRMEGQIKCFPDKVKVKDHHHQASIVQNATGNYMRVKKIKTMNIKMAINSQLPIIESK